LVHAFDSVSKSQAGRDAHEIRVPLSALAADPSNPREMSDAARAGLGVSLETFGELGMVFNDRTGQWVSGHQRLERLQAAGAVECVRAGDDGYIEHPKTGERFRVRFVDWDATKQRMANLVANNPKISGDFTDAALAQLKELEGEDGFSDLGLDALEKDLAEVEEKPDVARKRAELEDFDLAPTPKKAWIMIATSSDLLPEIEAAVRKFEGDETRIEVSGASQD
jgi:hypothetical protein